MKFFNDKNIRCIDKANLEFIQYTKFNEFKENQN